MNRRHVPEEWKLQPTKWLSPELERHEILVGTMSLLITGNFQFYIPTPNTPHVILLYEGEIILRTK